MRASTSRFGGAYGVFGVNDPYKGSGTTSSGGSSMGGISGGDITGIIGAGVNLVTGITTSALGAKAANATLQAQLAASSAQERGAMYALRAEQERSKQALILAQAQAQAGRGGGGSDGSTPTWLPWAFGGLVLTVAGVLVFTGRRKKS